MNDNDKIPVITGENKPSIIKAPADDKPDKVKALAEKIISECKQQGFTVQEMICLIIALELKRLVRETELQHELI